jgi:hypothetical protein
VPVAAVEEVWAAVASDYPYLAYNRIDWQGLRRPWLRRASRAGPAQTLALLAEMLAALADGHVLLSTRAGEHLVPWVPPRMQEGRRTFETRLALRHLAGGTRTTSCGRIAYGLLPGNVGYLHLPGFQPAGIVAECDEALAALRGTRALVVDDRSSAGGNRAEAYGIVARFLDSPLAAPPWYTRGERRQWPLIEPAGACRYRGRVAVLVNGLTFSAAELFADLMTRRPSVTLVGETTAGGSSGWDEDAPGHHRLPGGVRLRIPTVDGRGVDGTPWETVGIRPHVHVRQTRDDLTAGRDRHLEHALNLIREEAS